MYRFMFKRLFDIIFSIVMGIILLPVTLLCMIVIFLSTGSPVFFTQGRMGRYHRPFTVLKLRTMIRNAELRQDEGLSYDKLITREGRLLRKLHFDEFPQLINVFLGQMSVVGPRPLSIKDYSTFAENNQEYNILNDFRPGITGLASIYFYASENLRKKLLNTMGLKKLPCDENHFSRHKQLADYYHEHCSLLLDLKILYWTGLLVLEKRFSK